jgi:AcrR family transcriptional regulator
MKRELLDQIVAYLAKHGLGEMSLRPMAAELRTSPNRLVHHFGPKNELLTLALRRAIVIQRDVELTWLARKPDIGQADLLRKWWKWMLAEPENLAIVRLGLEAATLEATYTGLPGEVRAEQIGLWRTNMEQRLRGQGLSDKDAALEATLLKGTFTGLMIDLMATGERNRLGRALEEGLRRHEMRVAESVRARLTSTDVPVYQL